MFFFIELGSIFDTPTTKAFTFSLAPSPWSITTSLTSIMALVILTQAFLNNIEVYKDKYKHERDI